MENLANRFITVLEYLEIERNSQEKHEYYHGELFVMAGASETRNLIVSNLIAIFHTKFVSQPCVVYPSDMKVVIDKERHYSYPDVTVVCGERKFLDDKNDALLNPGLIVEVLEKTPNLLLKFLLAKDLVLNMESYDFQTNLKLQCLNPNHINFQK